MSPPSGPATTASLRRRLAACTYDAFAVVGVVAAAGTLAMVLTGFEQLTPGSLGYQLHRAYLLAAIYLYFAISWRRGGQTLGLRAWSLRVVQTGGGTPTWSQTAIRFVVAAASLAAFGAGFVSALFDDQRRTWHDRASGTRVARTPKPG